MENISFEIFSPQSDFEIEINDEYLEEAKFVIIFYSEDGCWYDGHIPDENIKDIDNFYCLMEGFYAYEGRKSKKELQTILLNSGFKEE